MVVRVLLAVAGLVVLTFAADHLVLGSSRLAQRLRISPVVVGVVVIGLGTSAPEFLVSGVAAARGDTGLAVGNIAGSNILNLTLVLGIAALAGRVAVTSHVIRREVPLAVGAVVLFSFLAWVGLRPVTGAALGAAARLQRVGDRDRSRRTAGHHRLHPGRARDLAPRTRHHGPGPAPGRVRTGRREPVRQQPVQQPGRRRRGRYRLRFSRGRTRSRRPQRHDDPHRRTGLDAPPPGSRPHPRRGHRPPRRLRPHDAAAALVLTLVTRHPFARIVLLSSSPSSTVCREAWSATYLSSAEGSTPC